MFQAKGRSKGLNENSLIIVQKVVMNFFKTKKMVKKGYCGNDSFSLAWNHMEVFQINPFYTTSSALSTSPLHVSTCHQET